MLHGGMVRAHGGQNGVAGRVVQIERIEAVLRGTTRTIRVWQGFGDAEEFTIDEARLLCARGDQSLMYESDAGSEFAAFMIDSPCGTLQMLTVPRRWLIAFLAAMRRALRTVDAVGAMERRFRPDCIDAASDPGSWARHLRDTECMRAATGGARADSS